MNKRNEKGYTIRKVEDNFKSNIDHITEDSDVGNEPFPFTEEENEFNEQFHFGFIDENNPM